MLEKNEPRPVIISLDQVAISFLEPRTPIASVWSQIKSFLITGVETGKLVCPIPPETVWESALLSEERYRRVSELQNRLSRGFSFKPFSRLLAEEVLALVRTGIDISPWEYGRWNSLRDTFVGSASRDEFLKFKENVEQQVSSLPVTRKKEQNKRELGALLGKELTFDLYKDLDRLRMGQPIVAAFAYTEDICEYLKDNTISNEEIERLKQLLLHHKYESIPIRFYYNRLITQLALHSFGGKRKPEANDYDDLTRAATALWASDVYVCEAEFAELCKQSGIHQCQAVPTLVLSVRQPELFLKFLECLLEKRLTSQTV